MGLFGDARGFAASVALMVAGPRQKYAATGLAVDRFDIDSLVRLRSNCCLKILIILF